MKAIYSVVTDLLRNDSDLKGFVKFTQTHKNIRRAYMPQGKWERLIIFYLQPETVMTDFSKKIRQVPLIIRVYDRADDLNCDNMGERIILLLDGADLSVSGEVYVYDCSYTGELSATTYNDVQKSYEKILRFMVRFRMDGIVGSSGCPVRKRQEPRQGDDDD